jgi:flavorubredoxin
VAIEQTTFDPVKHREVVPGIHWLIGCAQTDVFDGSAVHVHTSCYLIVGSEKAALFDTSQPHNWLGLEQHLDRILLGRTLDYVVPSHPEVAHGGNLARLLGKYPTALGVGDVRDYHMYFPQFTERLMPARPGTVFDLGGGSRLVLVEAPVKDAPNTIWAYEEKQRVLFSSDAFSYTHHPPVGEDMDSPVHSPGDCDRFSTELASPPSVEQAAFITKAALYWSRFVNIGPFLAQVEDILDRHPARIVAPAHGNVVTDIEGIMPIIREVHRQAYGEMLRADRTTQ